MEEKDDADNEDKPPTAPRERQKRRRRSTIFGSGLLVVVAVVGGAIAGLAFTDRGGPASSATSTSTGSVPSTRGLSGSSKSGLNGPASDVTAQTVADTLNIAVTDLPSGWANGRSPWARTATLSANVAFANCLGIPLGHIGIITGSVEPGGPSVVDSSWVDSSAKPAEGFESDVALAPDTSTELGDLQALSSAGAASCFQGWFATLDSKGDQITKPPTVTDVSVPRLTGENGAGFAISLSVETQNKEKAVTEELVFLGAGRVEVGLMAQSIGGPVRSSLESAALSALEHRLQSAAS
jgi:hypothetical protein